MKTVMKMYVEKGSILPGEESEAENNQAKENRTSKKDLPTLSDDKKGAVGGGRSQKPGEMEGTH